MNKSIWFINQAAGSPYHGMVFRTYYLGHEMLRKGYNVTIFSGSFSHNYFKEPAVTGLFTEEYIDGIRYIWVRLPRYPQSKSIGRVISMFVFPFLMLFYRLGNKQRPDAIIVSSPPPVAFLAGLFWSWRTNSKLFFEVRDIWPLSIQSLGRYSSRNPFIFILSLIERLAYRKSDYVASVLPKAYLHFETRGMKEGKFLYVPNGVLVEPFFPGSSETYFSLKKLKDEGKFIVGYTGTVGFANSLMTMVDVANQLKNQPDLCFVIVGDGSHKKLLLDTIKKLDIQNFHILPPVSKKEIPAILELIDIGYIGLLKDDLFKFGISPNKIFDYMLAKKPIVMAIDAGNDLVQEANCGISVPSCDANEVADAISKLYSLPKSELEKLGQNAFDFVEVNHRYNNIVHGYLKTIEKRKLVYVVLEDKAFLIQRLNLATAALNARFEVHVVSKRSSRSQEIVDKGFIYHEYGLDRSSLNIFGEISLIFRLIKIFKQIRPDIVHNISLKPVIYGTLAARLSGVSKIVNLINGLGFSFSGESIKQIFISSTVKILSFLILRSRKVQTIFQNPDDQLLFEKSKLLLRKNSHLILGSGVDTNKFHYIARIPTNHVRFVFISRMIWDKGIKYLIEAIRILKKENLDFEVQFVGAPDPKNMNSVKEDDLLQWDQEGLIKYLGFKSNMMQVLEGADVSILPTFYREGVPLSLIEGASTGIAIITTDTPGCREIVKNGVNGILVAPKDSADLASAMRRFILEPELALKMGLQGRKRVEEIFSSARVNEATMAIYNR